MSEEDVYYGDGEVWVTSERIVANGRDYWLKGTKSASVEGLGFANRRWLLLPVFIITGLNFLLILANQDTPQYEPFLSFYSFLDWFIWLCLLILVILLVAQPFLIRRVPKGEIYAISLYRGHGWLGQLRKRPVIASTDRSYIQPIEDAIHLELARQGHFYEDGESSQRGLSSVTQQGAGKVRISIEAGTITANDETRPLSSVKSVTRGSISFSPVWWLPSLGLVSLLFVQNLFYVLTRGATKSDSYVILSLIVFLAIAVGFIALFACIALSLDQTAYTVIIRGTFGSEIIYASMSQVQAKKVRDAIKQAVQNKGMIQLQPHL